MKLYKTWNPVNGCWGPGGTAEKPNRCPYCYAKGISGRFSPFEKTGYVQIKMQCMNNDPFQPMFWPNRLSQPAKVKKPSKIFVCSMGDLFGDWVYAQWIMRIRDVAAIVAPWHTYIFLTKNPKRLKEFNPWPKNCWVGCTVTNQPDMDERWPWLAQVEAPVRFVSHEPLLGGTDVRFHLGSPTGNFQTRKGKRQMEWKLHGLLNWAIIGALTGPGAAKHRPDPAWVQGLIDQYRAAGVPVFLKENLQWPEQIQEWPRADSLAGAWPQT